MMASTDGLTTEGLNVDMKFQSTGGAVPKVFDSDGKVVAKIQSGSERESRVIDLIDRVCRSVNISKQTGDQLTGQEKSDRADQWAAEGQEIVTTDDGENMLEDPAVFEEAEEYFKEFERKETKIDNLKEFEMIEAFIKEEKTVGRKRREQAQLLAASQEVRIAAEVAEIKGYRLKEQSLVGNQKLHQKVADAEKSFAMRKMAIGKAARSATSDVRMQFKRVRDFFQALHETRVEKLRGQYGRSLKIQSVLHRLRKADPRVMALEQNTAERIFRKKETDIQELNMVQNLEEATYLEKIIALLDKVQETKEVAADAYFQLQMKNIKSMHDADQKRADELTDLRAKGMLDMAELIAKYVKEEFQDKEENEKTKELVEATERKKDFLNSNSKVLLSISDLYDSILWSVATTSGLSSSETDTFDSYDDIDDDDDDEEENNNNTGVSDEGSETQTKGHCADTSDTASVESGSTANTTSAGSTSGESISPVAHIFVKKLRKEIHMKEREMEKRHKLERKREKRAFRAEARKLKLKHRGLVEGILAECVDERHRLREAISQRMASVEQNQSESSLTLQEAIETDVKAMQEAWVEHKRLEEEQKTSFAKAQTLISAQVFHEVRNALSSVVAMSEMTSSLQRDPSVVPETLISSVSEMLDQNKEVVNYSLSMLNNILDVSKIKAGSFETKNSFFDLQDLVNRSTTMQLVKAQTKGVKMSFLRLPEPQIAYTDEDIVVRIITNFISNAVKFTKAGAIQPFVCPIEFIDSSQAGKTVTFDKNTKPSAVKKPSKENDELTQLEKLRDKGMKLVAVGVADTGPGLSRGLLDMAAAGLFNSDAKKMNSGAKNSGFGLHLAHQLAGTLGSLVNLTDLESFTEMYNPDMASVVSGNDLETMSVTSSEGGSVSSDDNPGKGTVLYITVPVLSDGQKAFELLKSTPGTKQVLDMSSKRYLFSPCPSPKSVDGCFRILVADDVSMLRKGLVRSVLDIFSQYSDCPISVSTACTAEDALRAIGSDCYDMFICDNQFAVPNDLNKLPPEREQNRTQVRSDENKNLVRNSVTEFFQKESFTIEPGDGSLSGLDALLQLAQTKNNHSYPTPILVLHSGHELELPLQLGVIVVRKPLKRADFIPLFERNAYNLVETGMCVEVKRGNETVVLNKAGAQLFKRRKSSSKQ